MPGKKSKRKGYRGEAEIVRLLRQHGVDAKRVPLSGSAKHFQPGDVVIEGYLTAEVKRRKNGFKQLYEWLENRNLVFLRADRRPWLVVMDFELFLQLMRREQNE